MPCRGSSSASSPPRSCRPSTARAESPLSSEGIVAVDCHAHVMRRDLPLAPDRHSGPKRDVSVEEYLATLDEHGISHGVLTAPSFYAPHNPFLLTPPHYPPNPPPATPTSPPA